MAPERKLYQKLKSKTPKIIWNRLENLSLSGTPDLLGYNTSGHFFTVELKVTKSNKVRFSPHQIAFHFKHPQNTFMPVVACTRHPPEWQENLYIKHLTNLLFMIATTGEQRLLK